MRRLILLFLLLLAMPSFAQDLRPSAYIGRNGVITVRGGKVLGAIGGVTTISNTDITPANSATTYIYLDLSSTPAVTSNTSGFPSSNFFPICIVVKDANGIITSFTDSRPDYFMAGGGGGGGGGTCTANCVYADDPVFGMKWDAHVTWGCTYSIGNTTITCPNAHFLTDAAVNQWEFATNIGAAGFGSAVSSVITIPYGQITQITDDTHVVVSVAPTANSVVGSASFNWGTPEGDKLNTAWHAAADICGELLLPAGKTFSNRGQFNYYRNDCLAGGGASKNGQGVHGEGTASTTIILTPDFDFTEGAGQSCDGVLTGGRQGCFLSVNDQVSASDFTFYGAGLNTSTATRYLVNFACDNGDIHDVNFASFQGGESNMRGLNISCAFMSLDHLIVDGFGGVPCTLSGGAQPSGNPMRISNSYCGDSIGTAMTVLGIVESTNSYYQGNASDSVAVSTNASWNSVNDKYYSTGSNITSGRPLLMVGAGAVVQVTQGSIYNGGNAGGVAFLSSASGETHFRGTRFGCLNNCTGIYIFGTTDKVIDDGGNKDTASTPVNNAGPGFFSGTASITGTAQVAANWSTPAGAGAGQWGTSPSVGTCSGFSIVQQCTITVGSGTVGANPVLTVTHPTSTAGFAGFWVPPICDARMIGGTAALANVTTTTSTATTASFTYQGTPAASSTVILKVSCDLP